MGFDLFPVLEVDIPGIDPLAVQGKSVAAAMQKLGALAKAEGVTSLWDFYSESVDEAASFLASEGVDPAEVAIAPEEWFQPSEGLKTIRWMMSKLKAQPRLVSRSRQVLDDLRAWERVLAAADASGVRFHVTGG